MLAVYNSATIIGLDVISVEVEVDISSGLPGISIVGLPNKSVEEAKERVKASLQNSGFSIPAKRMTINLAPGDIKKEGTGFDLPIAVGILTAAGYIPQAKEKTWYVGELALTGETRHVPGILPIAQKANELGIDTLFVPATDGAEAAVIKGLKVIPVENILQLSFHLKKEDVIEPQKFISSEIGKNIEYDFDFAYIKGQKFAKRALEIAAGGGHNLLMSGPPGAGKTLLARSLPSILPSLSYEEKIEISKIYSLAGLLQGNLISMRPFRNPHHTSSAIAIIGGGTVPKPGEVTLAHLGILFLDELPEFPRHVLEVLRQPLEDGVVTIARAHSSLQFPAKFTLIAAKNPCSCGFYQDPKKDCICSPHQINNYQKKVSGPLLDRIDLQIEVPKLKTVELTEEILSEKSRDVRKRVELARAVQNKRYRDTTLTNANLNSKQIKKYIKLTDESKDFLAEVIDKFELSARGYSKVIKVSRTIADLSNCSEISVDHIAEAVQYRPKKELI